ncbi:protein FAM177A1 [Contarinia nasturtii]|uniref:protein FAM177A1 n=1 Tax=Contarinia nasturtii TaxID=265458 RepID=UPI0012D458D0|nr:protein FAM177A1 [Contarinia nasturtii]
MTELQVISKLSESEQQPPTALTSVHIKTPRRILHFSDGTMEEYSTDDEVDGKNKDYRNDEKGQGPSTMFDYVLMGGNRVLATCDYVGEKIASALGITTPKYKYEIEQFKKIEKERKKAEEEEKSTGGWMQQTHNAQCKLPENVNNKQPITQEILQKY